MTKLKFILSLNELLSDLPKKDVEERLAFYSELIDDRMEEGVSEEEAVGELGSVEDIAASIKEELSSSEAKITVEMTEILKAEDSDSTNACNDESKKKGKSKWTSEPWVIILLIVGAPLWLSLLIGVVSIIFSIYATVWSVVISLWAVFASFIACAIGGIAGGIAIIVFDSVYNGVAMIGMGICFIGLSIFMFYISKLASKGVIWLTKTSVRGIKKCFSKKEA